MQRVKTVEVRRFVRAGALIAAVLMAPAAGAAQACGPGEAPADGACRPVEEIAAHIRGLVEDGMASLNLSAAIVKIRIGDVDIMEFRAFLRALTVPPEATEGVAATAPPPATPETCRAA